MIDLSKQSGLPLAWNRSTERLIFTDSLREMEPDIRRREDMREVLYDAAADDSPELDKLYYMYRGVGLEQDYPLMEEQGLRYDVTVIRPGTIGREYIKTAGHYHVAKPGTTLTFPEIYEVLHGRAHYLLQRPHGEQADGLEEVVLIAAKPGDKVLIPPNFGHITINPGDDFLIMSNWVAAGFPSDYEPVRRHGGGGYYELQGEEGPEFVANKHYAPLPPLQRSPVIVFPKLNLITGLPVYTVFQQNPSAFDYLVNPQLYTAEFAEYLEQLREK